MSWALGRIAFVFGICAVAMGQTEVRRGEQAAAKQEPKPAAAFDPTTQYDVREIEGWRVMVNKHFVRDQSALCDETMKLLADQLYQVLRKAPADAVAKLRKITIWVEEAEGHHPCMAYHPNPGWLREHGMNPEKAGCVEIANARNFLSWTREQPWMVLHELAHGYHDRFLGGYGNRELVAAYDRMKAAKRYESVLHVRGKTERAYAATNVMEYFAETSEAFFGTNDFYPFVRGELKQHDPEMHELLEKLWGTAKPQKGNVARSPQ